MKSSAAISDEKDILICNLLLDVENHLTKIAQTISASQTKNMNAACQRMKALKRRILAVFL